MADRPLLRLRQPFDKGYRMMQIRRPSRPKGGPQWVRYVWGTDLWLGPIPFMKTTVAVNVAVWTLMWWLR